MFESPTVTPTDPLAADEDWPPPVFEGWEPRIPLDAWELEHDPALVLGWMEAEPEVDGYVAALLDRLDHSRLSETDQLRLSAQWQRVEAAVAGRKLAGLAKAFPAREAAPASETTDATDATDTTETDATETDTTETDATETDATDATATIDATEASAVPPVEEVLDIEPEPGVDDSFTDLAIAAELTLSQPAAARMLGIARTLATRLPVTRARQLAGGVPYLAAMRIADGAARLSPEQCPAYERFLWPTCDGMTIGQVAYQVDKALARIAADRLERQHERARRDSYLDVTGRDDVTKPANGVGRILGRGSSFDLMIISVAVEAYARKRKAAGDPRSLDELRLEALVEFSKAYLRGELPGAGAPTSHGTVCTINIGVGLDTFLGLSNGPLELLGHGVFLPASTLDELLPDAGLRRMITDKMTGYLLDLSPDIYRPGPAFSRFIKLRDVTATAPGSQVPADATQLDHGEPFDDGGITIRANVGAIGKRWHDAKTRGGWTVIQDPDGTRTWTSPTGRSYRTTPHDHRLGP